jgi:small subunit ribosomal protein S21
MPTKVKARAGESAEGLMRRFKKACEKDGLRYAMRRSEVYEKPSDARRRKSSARTRSAAARR